MPRAVLAVLLLAGCSSVPSPVTIGPAGGLVRVDGVELDVPPGALETEVQIVIERVAVPAGYRASGDAAFRFRPEGLHFRAPLTVRFDLEAGDEDAVVHWSRAGDPVALEPLATRLEAGRAVASIEHFSVGLAGWPAVDDAGPPDGGPSDAAVSDGGVSDGGISDGGPLDGGSDGGVDGGADVGVITGVTCVVAERASCSVAPTPATFTDVPFSLRPASIVAAEVPGLSSPLDAFQTLYATSSIPVFSGDAEGARYTVGAEGPNITRRGLRIDVDVHVSRAGSACPPGSPGGPLIQIDCTGSTLVTVGPCRSRYPIDRLPTDPVPPPLSCTVRRRDAACALLPSTAETPMAWVAAGWHGPSSELFVTSPAIAEAVGGPLRFFQEDPCDSYATDVALGADPILRGGEEIWIESLGRSSGTTCRDLLGARQPVVEVRCAGLGTLGPPP